VKNNQDNQTRNYNFMQYVFFEIGLYCV